MKIPGAGVTFGGGEPTAAGEFFLDLAEASLYEGWHVTVDTCGFCPEERFDKALKLADLSFSTASTWILQDTGAYRAGQRPHTPQHGRGAGVGQGSAHPHAAHAGPQRFGRES